MDIKYPVSSLILIKQQNNTNIEAMAHSIDQKFINQKHRFCDLQDGPTTSQNVLYIVDLAYVPVHEKQIVKDFCMKGIIVVVRLE